MNGFFCALSFSERAQVLFQPCTPSPLLEMVCFNKVVKDRLLLNPRRGMCYLCDVQDIYIYIGLFSTALSSPHTFAIPHNHRGCGTSIGALLNAFFILLNYRLSSY